MKSLKGFAYELGYSLEDINKVIENIDNHYYQFEKKKIKQDGSIKIRIIEPSKGRLQSIQKRLVKKILPKVKLIPNIVGGVKGKCNITNARLHQGKKYHLCTDIKNFFPSIRHNQVYTELVNNNFSPRIAEIVTKLTTYKGKLPQGTPTSTAIANIVFQRIDLDLLKICNENQIIYSRFVDDLVFSSENCFKHLQEELLNLITQNGFRRSQRKTFYKSGLIEVTGIVVKQNKLDITNKMKEKLKSNLSENSREGLENYVKRIKSKN